MKQSKKFILMGCFFALVYHLPLWAQDSATAMLARFWRQTYPNERPLAPQSQDQFSVRLLAKAPVDQCFNGIAVLM